METKREEGRRGANPARSADSSAVANLWDPCVLGTAGYEVFSEAMNKDAV